MLVQFTAKPLFTFGNNHDIVQETVIELMQQEADEEVSSLQGEVKRRE